ncbi:class I SAM-dependent methyltransferase [Parvibaculum sp.]|uniref:class I SAM-dependent methyltransferase n=1 Tax=Parvibaculum sp. TaxID=2024848 RepID=UPI0025EB92D3|nr:class I SAM-dependent methyltransferase [Parvibaculum sp.]
MSEQNAAPNAEQIEVWNGATGAKWVRYQDRLDRMLAPFGEAVIRAASIQPGERVLDVGCGCGATTLDAATRTGPGGRVLGVDISLPMVERARERSAARKLPAAFAVSDASLHDFGDDAFDLLISRFGVMFFDEPAAAFTNLHGALAKNGRLAFVCWRTMPENPWLAVPLRAALPLLPPFESPPPGAPGPFAFADSARVTALLTEAGFRDIEMKPFDAQLVLGTPGGDPVAEALDQSLEIGPLSRLLADQPDDLRRRVAEAVRAELAKHQTADGVTVGGATWIVTAKA